MANNYMEFSVMIDLKNDAEKDWCERHLGVASRYEGSAVPVELYDAEGTPVASEAKLWERTVGELGDSSWSFEWSILEPNRGSTGGRLWLRTDTDGSPYQAACVLHSFLEQLRPSGDDLIIISWAETCSKPRPGEFGGGTMVVTKHGIGTCSPEDQFEMARGSVTHPWLLEQIWKPEEEEAPAKVSPTWQQDIADNFFKKQGLQGPSTKRVRIHLAALTRLEWSCEVSVPKKWPAFASMLVDHFYDEIEGSEFEEDPDYWERGHCYVEECDPPTADDADQVRLRQGWNADTWAQLHEDFIRERGLRDRWDAFVTARADEENGEAG